MRIAIPWWLKVLLKLILSRLPINYRVWQAFGVFRHGGMDHHAYLTSVFDAHFERSGFLDNAAGKTILEVGPGDSVGTALVAASQGCRAILVDEGNFALRQIEFYKELATELKRQGRHPPDLSGVVSLDGVLKACNGVYLTNGIESFSRIETGSVDFVFSQAVLEHVRRNEFDKLLLELYRVLSPRGVTSHRVDLRDHLDGGLNNLRFSHSVWEHPVFASSGFYTNRLRYTQILDAFEASGFTIDSCLQDRYAELPISRKKLNKVFLDWPDEELMIKGFTVVLKPKPILPARY